MSKSVVLLCRLFVALAVIFVVFADSTEAQDRLKSMPGQDRYQKLSKEIPTSVKFGSLRVTWKDEGKSFEYKLDGKNYRYDIATAKETALGAAKEEEGGDRFFRKGGGRARAGRGGVPRGRQLGSATSPDGTLKAFYRDRNLYLGDPKGVFEIPITSEANEKNRLKFGSASWVYGEELDQRTAIWWSPDNKKIAFYRFDESPVLDYYLTTNQTGLQTKIDAEPYPKAGTNNPIVDLLVYDIASKKTMKIDVREGKAFDNAVVGHYVYNVDWSPDGKEILFHRTNRLQNILEFAAADPESGKCRVILREEWPASWVENSPPMQFLKDGMRFLWISERNGFRNIYLYNLEGKLLATLTNHSFEVANILHVDEAAGLLFYSAHDGDNPMKVQLHRVGLDGKDDKRLTDPAFHHSVDIAPDGKHFIDIAETHDAPPTTRLADADGKIIVDLAKSDTTRFEKLGLKKVELLRFKAADNETELFGMLYFPSNFDPNGKYPLLVSVYAGPGWNAARESFVMPSALAEYGFLVATFDSRSAGGRGKKFLDAIYGKLGTVEVDDQAAGVKSLWDRSYLDKTRVGIFGTSYGGTVSATCMVRHPDVFQAASASSAISDYRLYDTIYTERYMGTPQDNKAGYDKASILTQVDKLKGRLLLYYGTADNNVHPSNTLKLIAALQRAGKSFEVQVGPDMGHGPVSLPRMMEFFIENLVVNPKRL